VTCRRMVMTSGQRVELTRLLERHPAILEHVHPVWKLKRLQPVQLVDLADTLGIDLPARASASGRRWWSRVGCGRGGLPSG
jgi:hypothetical protein